MTNDDQWPGVTNIVDGDVEQLIQVGHIGDAEEDFPSGGGVTNVCSGNVGTVIQAGNITGGLNL